VEGFLNKIVKRLRGIELSTDNKTQLEWSYFGKGIFHCSQENLIISSPVIVI